MSAKDRTHTDRRDKRALRDLADAERELEQSRAAVVRAQERYARATRSYGVIRDTTLMRNK